MPPGPPGIIDGHLAPCPQSPNCVVSQSTAASSDLPPVNFRCSAATAMRCLRELIEQQPRAIVVHADNRYLHAEFRSRLFRFVDDVEFLLDERQQVIHFRSASRTGYWDLGANRRRMQRLCALLERALIHRDEER